MVSHSEKYDNLFTKLALIPLAIRNPVLGRIASNKIKSRRVLARCELRLW